MTRHLVLDATDIIKSNVFLKEPTDTFLLLNLKDSNGSLELAVAFLTAKNAKTPQQEETTYYQTATLPGNDRYISVGSQADTTSKCLCLYN